MSLGEKAQITKAARLFHELREKTSSLVLGTVGNNGFPNVSYAPFVSDEDGNFFVYLSGLSDHTTKLLTNPVAAVLLIEDESSANQIFARKRISYQCVIDLVERDDANYETILNAMSTRFGNVVNILRSLPDFYLFQLSPVSGRFVTGFGQSYELSGDNLMRLVHIGVDQLRNA
jgi:putative heme iron utilization protein